MKKVDKLLKQAKIMAGIRGNVLDNYDFKRLSTEELKELAYGNPSEERFNELISRAAKPAGGD
ncbi:hypothetical protein H0486_18145 [Lachnospiraceae bacterium MD1]|uniref:Uncharacterized protein n=1 Tax=Variimorphobacter saccharofermentans TaxID=2755051 RepID=A0A839K597_9FIRM|nr:hypothetical protein [Variimorphobacter saccharofermentans]MBB2184780.1 hypothetical protein [Variimorphobacter saccharofermentans]